MNRVAMLVVVALLGLVASVSGQVAGCAGAGSTAQAPLIDRLRAGVACLSALPRYAGGGSKLGQSGINRRAYDYGLSDNPLLPCNVGKVVNVAYAVGLMSLYAKASPSTPNILMTQCAIPTIFTGVSKAWNSAIMIQSDPRLRTRTARFKVIIRSDESGTTWTLTNMMSKGCRARWPYTQLYRFNAARPLIPFYNSATKGSGNSAVVALFNAAGANAITYTTSTRLASGFECRLQINRPTRKFLLHSQTNFGVLTQGLSAGATTCNAGTDITALPRDVYPFCYLAWFLAWLRTQRANKPCVKNMCTCLLSPTGQSRINAEKEYKALPTTYAATMRRRCPLL